MKPKISVVSSHYNDGQWLPISIGSILNQSFQDFEFIISDDASTDEASLEVLREYERLDSRIRVIYNKENRGPAWCHWQASEAASGEYLHGIGADDVHYPDLLTNAIKHFEKDPEIGLFWTAFDWGTEDNKQIEDCGFSYDGNSHLLTPLQAQDRLLNHDLKTHGATSVYRRDLSAKYGHYIDKLSYYSDWFLLNLILLNHKSAFLAETNAYFRVRDGNYSNTNRHNKRHKMAVYDAMLEWLERKEHKLYKKQFRKAGLLVPIFQDRFWSMLLNPKYLHYWPYIAKKYPVGERIKHSLTKRFKTASN